MSFTLLSPPSKNLPLNSTIMSTFNLWFQTNYAHSVLELRDIKIWTTSRKLLLTTVEYTFVHNIVKNYAALCRHICDAAKVCIIFDQLLIRLCSWYLPIQSYSHRLHLHCYPIMVHNFSYFSYIHGSIPKTYILRHDVHKVHTK